MEELRIEGRILADMASLEKYSVDKSPYKIKPRLIVIPEGEGDVEEVVAYSKKCSIPLTARAAGSNVSGSAVGKGIVVDFGIMNSILTKKGRRMRIQPGVIYDHLNEYMKKYGLFLPYSPGSGAFCTVGGNVATKASGLRGVKYGSVDNYVRAIRFISMEHGVVDTTEGLPADLEDAIVSLKRKLMADKKAMKILKSRESLKTSTGYNLPALYKYEDLGEAVAHLLVGSVGTLGLFTEIELELVPMPKNRMTCVGFFKDFKEASNAVSDMIKTRPSAIELMDSRSGIDIIGDFFSFHLPESKALLLIEFDGNLAEAELGIKDILEKSTIDYFIETIPKKQEEIWKARESALLRLGEEEGPEEKHLAFVDDLAVPVKNLTGFLSEIQKIFEENKMEVAIYGHAGEGNLHFRPLIKRKGWKTNITKLADLCFKAAFKHGGTVAGEHGSGRNRAPYLEEEWGKEVYGYFLEVKRIFDPKGMLNPGVMFSKADIIKHMKY